MSSSQEIVRSDDTRSSLVHRWAVAELQNLSFAGDCNALAQYVEILVENFCDTDTSDLEGLREHVRADLVDFIGADLARRFSDGLVKHLAEHEDFLNRDPDSDEPQPASSSDYVDITDHSALEEAGEPVDSAKATDAAEPAGTASPSEPETAVTAEPVNEPVKLEAPAHPLPSDVPTNNPSASKAPDDVKLPNPSEAAATPTEKKDEPESNVPSSSVAVPSTKQPSNDRDRLQRHAIRDRNNDRHPPHPEQQHHKDARGQHHPERSRIRDSQPSHRVKREPPQQVNDDVRRNTRPSVMDRLGARPDHSARLSQRDRDGNVRHTPSAKHTPHTQGRFNPSEREQARNHAVNERSGGPRDGPAYRSREYRTYRDSHDRPVRDTTSSPTRRHQSVENVHDRLGPRPSQSLKRARDEDVHPTRVTDAPASKRRSLDHDRRVQDTRPRQGQSLKRQRDEDDYEVRDVAPAKKRPSLESEKVEQNARPRSPKRAAVVVDKSNRRATPAETNPGAVHSQAPPLQPPMPTLEQMAPGVSWPFTPEMLAAMGMPPFFPLPLPGHISPVVTSNGIPLPPLQGPPFIPGAQPAGGKSPEATRAPGKPNSSGNSSSGAPSKHRHFILLARNIPSGNLMVGPIFAFFQRFGVVLDVVKAPPNKAFILFENRDSAFAALRSLEAVMGNRHISLAWARDSDFSEAGLAITNDGKLIERATGSDQNNHPHASSSAAPNAPNAPVAPAASAGSTTKARKSHSVDGSNEEPKAAVAQKGENKSPTKHVVRERGSASKGASNGLSADGSGIDPEAAADDLKRKRQKILAMRKEQEAQRAQRLERYQGLVKQQKDLFAELQDCTDEGTKLELVNKLRRAQNDALKVREEMKPSVQRVSDPVKSSVAGVVSPGHKGSAGPSAGGTASDGEALAKGRTLDGTPVRPKYGRDLSTFQVDNRPKVILVSGSVNVPEALAVAVFRDTERAVKVEDGWLIELSSRRAAESAMRAIGPLKRGFGPTATVQIVSRSLPASIPKVGTRVDAKASNGEGGSARGRRRMFSGTVNAPPQTQWNSGVSAGVSAGVERGSIHPVTGTRDVVSQGQAVFKGVAHEAQGVFRAAANQNPVAVTNDRVQQFQAPRPLADHGEDPMMD